MTLPAQKQSFEDQARKLVAARYSLVFIQTYEEERLEQILKSLSQRAFSQPVPLFFWSITEGLHTSTEKTEGTCEPVAALDAVIAYDKPALFLFRDLHRFWEDPRVARRLRDVYRTLRHGYKTVFLCAPVFNLPVELQKEVAVLDLPTPNMADLDRVFTEVCNGHKNLTMDLGEERDALLRGALGLLEDEARAAFNKILMGRRTATPEIIKDLYEEKQSIVRKEGILDFVPPSVSLDHIGGLATLKEWLRKRQRFFSREAEALGLDKPKGLLITGISGCGKTMAVKAISTYWRMPLIRLDMNRVYGAMAGTPERTLERAIKTAEAISPCVLWIDEIETALVGTHGEGAGQATRIFSSFLTWMQEKEFLVFVAATANEIDKLPPELLRKGRFDEIFFVDLPNEAERLEILSVHLAQRKQKPSAFDLVSLAKSTNGFNGAELEQLVLSGMYTSFDQNRPLEMNDLYRALGQLVPLSRTMVERIKEIKRWADTRALRAS
ncbi:MAG: AAA family ATPase [Pseudomonadota bacterium]